jgi:hypothetical protein
LLFVLSHNCWGAVDGVLCDAFASFTVECHHDGAGAGGKRELWVVVDDEALLSTWPGERLDQGYLDGIVDYCAFFIARRGCVVGSGRTTVMMCNKEIEGCGGGQSASFKMRV